MTRAERRSLGDRAPAVQWVALLILSVVFVVVLETLRLPAALLLGPMLAGLVLALAGGTVRAPAAPFAFAQAVLGCMIARSIPLSTLHEILHDWPLLLISVFAVIGASYGLGWLLARWGVLPGATAVWGSSPGGASAMIVMADAYGADARLVAVMQYMRVVIVASGASLVARMVAGDHVAGAKAVAWMAEPAWTPLVQTLALAIGSALLGAKLRFPSASMIAPLVLGVVLQDTGLIVIELPPILLAVSYALIGWSIGLRFTRPILIHAARALPRIIASIVVLIAACGGLAAMLVVMAGVDPLTAYLATSPGGADSVAIIAASSDVDLPFVMAMQTARLIAVLLTGPIIAKFIADRVQANERIL
ncbi:MAG: AbrB family transcriptional regulator [Phenylobacterium sp.]|uniref:AbrB family transcriptional regulator n=1 Tax=Phenylobacterium sp. TaxID=1871053 RepID=UPI002733B647|nr:AbrB family transcriptional regulator [Phenylobacterium sp.]MDP3176052.1 AbrB family transcriptional regulator [Phenylobacterium sp.]